MPAGHLLSKKSALAGLQCHKRLWWELHEPEAPELRESAAVRHRMDEGARVGVLARTYLPGGYLVSRGAYDIDALVASTRAAMADPGVGILYEAAFVAHDTLVFSDILQRVEGGWSLIEVKATTSVNDTTHVADIAVQAAVLRAAGVPVRRYELMHLDRRCQFPDLSSLFVREDVTARVHARLDDIERELAAQAATARRSAPPHAEIGAHCSRPDECPFKARCWPVQPEHHVRTLYRIGAAADAFVGAGWETIHDLPDSVKLGAIAARQRRAVREGSIVIDRDALVRALATVARPVAHIDFETVQPAVPVWPGCRPYEQVPVQLSCHVVGVDGTVQHRAWLFDGDGDPRPEAARAILDACAGARTVTAYYAHFERHCIELVADACPEHAAALRAIAGGIVDLLPIVRDHVYHPAFNGSFSLKKVLPALVPELSYDGLAIAEGETAQVQLARMFFERERMSDEERREIRDALLTYCELDTKAMVALEERLRALV